MPTKPRQSLTKKEIQKSAVKCVQDIKRLDITPSAIKRGLGRNKVQRGLAILLAAFMQKNNIHSVQALADYLFIGNDHIEVLEWLRNPVQYIPNGNKKRHKEYLLALCETER